ncbi:FAD:protein FMN transferase [Geothrix rubra]|uniref:FAD:protein FMN transferase n=1 Tax=Geothrix rubra TaxID=2927977 RepID=A0ABQ5Q5G7_9BACT|nr:FAD:protein FMN transferase [Geothrix rubra]GLH70000.1 FAD:protein FMN transferase [Geothrix rubra]
MFGHPAFFPLVPVLAMTLALDRTVLAMGTQLRIHLEGPGDPGVGSEAALREASRIEVACSTWDPASSWSRLNAAGGRPVALDGEWLDLLAEVQAWQVCTEGAFDPALGALMKAWGIREGGHRRPTTLELERARQASGSALLVLDRKGGTARFLDPGAALEEGGFLKGYALDRMRAATAAPSGLLDFGGQLLAWGHPVEAAIADPLDRQRPRLTLLLKDASLSCSGTSERGRHILDPRTGEPSPAWGSVAVVATEGLTADILSTALYVLGPERGLAWAERHGTAAAFLLNDGTIRTSAAFRALHPKELR